MSVPVEAAAAVANAVANVSGQITQLEAKLIEKIGGEGARNLFLDVRRISNFTDEAQVAGLLASTQQFVETLDVTYLNPLVGIVASGIWREARETFWG